MLPSSLEDWSQRVEDEREGEEGKVLRACLVEIMFQTWNREARHRPTFSSLIQQLHNIHAT